MKWKTATVASVATVVLLVAGTSLARAGGRGDGGVGALERKYYWSLLRADQKKEAWKAVGDFLAETAPDRGLAAASLFRWRAEASALLTVEQRKEAGKVVWFWKHLTWGEKREGLDQLLDATDRQALAKRVERLEGASPEDRVTIGLEIFDQLYDALEPRLAKALTLTAEQRTALRALYGREKDDLKPIALRLERAKVGLVRTGLALLDADQKAKFDAFRLDLRKKVLDFLTKTPAAAPK